MPFFIWKVERHEYAGSVPGRPVNRSAAPARRRTAASPVTVLRGVGPRIAELLMRLDITTVQDLLFHLPLRYQDRTRVIPLGALNAGDECLIEGEVLLTEIHQGRRRALLSRVSDGTGALTLRFFHFNAKQLAMLSRGVRVRCYGEVRAGPMTLEMVHPEFSVGGQPQSGDDRLTPVYPATEGLHQSSLRALADQALSLLDEEGGLEEFIPPAALASLHLPDLAEALRYVHRPPAGAPVAMLLAKTHPAQRRLAFEELLAHHLSLRRLRERARRHAAPKIAPRGDLFAAFQRQLPYRLTAAQQRVIDEIRSDLSREHPMQRLVQGDVGCGKTVVACAAVLHTVEAGYQVALMAPTELLADQHSRNFRGWLEPLGVELATLNGKIAAKGRREVLTRTASGDVKLLIGTHALFQQEVAFRSLGLVIVDEQHRFGVDQRLALRDKGASGARRPHQLIMTATPIPRTLAMVGYADLDCSVIDERPPGRKPVETVVVADRRRAEVVERVRVACLQGAQVYWVCTLIKESEALQCQAAEETAAWLAQALPDVRIGLVHGRMKAADKEVVMGAFQRGELELLVATTVIEVGVDVPNASLIIIENAERLGLAQLHQLRGRVGRGGRAAACVLLYHPPLGQLGRERLATLRETDDGFAIARRDLELRGPGEVLGTRQSGLVQFRVADLIRDQDLLARAAGLASTLVSESPARVEALIRRWLPRGQRYGEV